MMKSRE